MCVTGVTFMDLNSNYHVQNLKGIFISQVKHVKVRTQMWLDRKICSPQQGFNDDDDDDDNDNNDDDANDGGVTQNI